MSFEVEQKYRTDGHAHVIARLNELEAEAGPRVEQEDVYLNHPARDFATTHEALRIRSAGEKNALTYKGPKHPGPTKTRMELEIPFADGQKALVQMRNLFDVLGFRPATAIRKVRTSYHLTRSGRPIEVVLDVAESLGTFVEVETIAGDESDLPEAQKVVMDLGSSLGLTEVEPRSYLRMALELREGTFPG